VGRPAPPRAHWPASPSRTSLVPLPSLSRPCLPLGRQLGNVSAVIPWIQRPDQLPDQSPGEQAPAHKSGRTAPNHLADQFEVVNESSCLPGKLIINTTKSFIVWFGSFLEINLIHRTICRFNMNLKPCPQHWHAPLHALNVAPMF